MRTGALLRKRRGSGYGDTCEHNPGRYGVTTLRVTWPTAFLRIGRQSKSLICWRCVVVSTRGTLVLTCLAAACGGSDLTLPGPLEPARLVVVSGSTQQILAGQWVVEPLVVQVRDANDGPLEGVPITYRFAAEVPGSRISPSQVTSTRDGLGSALARLGEQAGEQLVLAQVDGSSSSGLRATFRLTALSPKSDDGGQGNGDDGGAGGGGGGGSGGGGGNQDDDPDDGGHHGGGHGHGHGDNGHGHDDHGHGHEGEHDGGDD